MRLNVPNSDSLDVFGEGDVVERRKGPEIHSAKAHRCVEKVGAKGHDTASSWAICTASIGKRGVYAKGHGGNANPKMREVDAFELALHNEMAQLREAAGEISEKWSDAARAASAAARRTKKKGGNWRSAARSAYVGAQRGAPPLRYKKAKPRKMEYWQMGEAEATAFDLALHNELRQLSESAGEPLQEEWSDAARAASIAARRARAKGGDWRKAARAEFVKSKAGRQRAVRSQVSAYRKQLDLEQRVRNRPTDERVEIVDSHYARFAAKEKRFRDGKTRGEQAVNQRAKTAYANLRNVSLETRNERARRNRKKTREVDASVDAFELALHNEVSRLREVAGELLQEEWSDAARAASIAARRARAKGKDWRKAARDTYLGAKGRPKDAAKKRGLKYAGFRQGWVPDAARTAMPSHLKKQAMDAVKSPSMKSRAAKLAKANDAARYRQSDSFKQLTSPEGTRASITQARREYRRKKRTREVSAFDLALHNELRQLSESAGEPLQEKWSDAARAASAAARRAKAKGGNWRKAARGAFKRAKNLGKRYGNLWKPTTMRPASGKITWPAPLQLHDM